MKYKPRSNVYSNSTNTNVFNPERIQAYSYNWWLYVAKINGKVVFNDYPYSASTRKHQYETRKLLDELNIKIDVVVSIKEGLQHGLMREAVLPRLKEQRQKLFTEMWDKKQNTQIQTNRTSKYSEISKTIKFIERNFK